MESVEALQDPFGLAGTLLEGQYRADRVVGEGGFGVVYQARHLSLDQPIAIKVLKGLDGGDPAINALILEKFRAEARLLYTLSQSSLHIVRALDFGAATMPSGAWAPFMILEWLDGRSLADDLNERRRLGMRGRPIAEALAILEPVADGLSAAHHRQVAHRDVKPANIFLLRDNAPGRAGPQVKVLDFGIAKIMKEGESVGTKGTFASFTWLYATPEQLDPRIGLTGLATDVYAFTLLVTELLTDRAPIDDRDVISIMKTATNPTRRPTPRTRGANVTDAVEAVCLRALAVDPKNRYATVGELWNALSTAAQLGRSATTGLKASGSIASPTRDPSGSSGAPVRDPSGTSAMPASVMLPPTRDPSGVISSQPTTAMPASLQAPSLQHPQPIPHMTALPMSAVSPGSPPPGTPPPRGFPTPPPGMPAMSPPPGTRPPSGAGQMMPFPAGPPPGTRPPGQPVRPLTAAQRADKTNMIVPITIVFFIVAVLFAGTCAMVHGACGG